MNHKMVHYRAHGTLKLNKWTYDLADEIKPKYTLHFIVVDRIIIETFSPSLFAQNGLSY